MKLNSDNWYEFKLKEIFKFQKGKCKNSNDLIQAMPYEENVIPYIGAKKSENGVMFFVKKNKDIKHIIQRGNSISFICQGAGSNGFNLYFPIETIQTTSNTLGFNKNLNENNALFIITVLDLERPKWSFGRGRMKNLGETIIKLPYIKSNEIILPDWKLMEDYIKKLRERVFNIMNNQFKK